ncbi:MAG TPA: hypothetical protein PL112_04850 [Candidatus Obscuribacter sp.]|nr:hypothetical protein [Candidatus Obscuribacter sp.]HND66097.1 hypothetical protein [Candidatus Obscuribacter sp.]HNG75160.1 hypothetical protein [Candidatus Obscuribacter sp.]HNH73975.1 hypothetical protein [Candidatus Obscuribacter sp.]
MKHQRASRGGAIPLLIILAIGWSGYAIWLFSIWPPHPGPTVIAGAIVMVCIFVFSLSVILHSSFRHQPPPFGLESLPDSLIPKKPVRLENWSLHYHKRKVDQEADGYVLQGFVYGDPNYADGTEITTGRIDDVVGKVVRIHEYWVILGKPSEAYREHYPDYIPEMPLWGFHDKPINHHFDFDELERSGRKLPPRKLVKAIEAECLRFNN